MNRSSYAIDKVWFISDTHFGHANILKYCNRWPFMTIEERAIIDSVPTGNDNSRYKNLRISKQTVCLHDDIIIDNINKSVGANDTLWHLGDFAFVKEDFKRAKEYRERISCKNINFIWGNHDRRNLIKPLFGKVYDLHEIKINIQKITLCHYAMLVWNCSHHNAIHLCGHSHGTLNPWLDEHMPSARIIDVGIDSVALHLAGDNPDQILPEYYRPISFLEILSIMSGKTGHQNIDHHSPA